MGRGVADSEFLPCGVGGIREGEENEVEVLQEGVEGGGVEGR